MSIVYKKTLRKSPLDPSDTGKYYPQLVTVGRRMTKEKIIYDIKEKSSLSAGDIESVTTNFVETIGRSLLAGYSVQIPKLGRFSLSVKAEGSETEEECTSRKIRSIHVNFHPAANLRPNLAATRAEDKVEFVDLMSYIKSLSLNGMGLTGADTDTENSGEDTGGGIYIDPNT
jgi:predicted histone-like DNA-binding protein